MDSLCAFEEKFGRPRNQWTKSQWREVAEQLAIEIDGNLKKKRPGRPPLNRYEKDIIPALAFWADQAVEEARSNGVYLSFREAVSKIRMESARKALEVNTKEDKAALRRQRITPDPESEKGVDMLLTSVIKRIEKYKREAIKGK